MALVAAVEEWATARSSRKGVAVFVNFLQGHPNYLTKTNHNITARIRSPITDLISNPFCFLDFWGRWLGFLLAIASLIDLVGYRVIVSPDIRILSDSAWNRSCQQFRFFELGRLYLKHQGTFSGGSPASIVIIASLALPLRAARETLETIAREVIAPLLDPVKMATLKGKLPANPRLYRALYWLETARRAGGHVSAISAPRRPQRTMRHAGRHCRRCRDPVDMGQALRVRMFRWGGHEIRPRIDHKRQGPGHGREIHKDSGGGDFLLTDCLQIAYRFCSLFGAFHRALAHLEEISRFFRSLCQSRISRFLIGGGGGIASGQAGCAARFFG